MCRTVHSIMVAVICGTQMLVRIFMTVLLMTENIVRLVLQTGYNFLSFMMQMLSLIPICVVYVVFTRIKCFVGVCGGGGPCPVNRGGACDCLMSAVAIVIVFFILRSTGILDKIFYQLGYAKAIAVTKFVPSPGPITECSRNESYDESTARLRRQGLDIEVPEGIEGPKLLRVIVGMEQPEENEEPEEKTETKPITRSEREKESDKDEEPEGKEEIEEDISKVLRADAENVTKQLEQKVLEVYNTTFGKSLETTIMYYLV